MLLQLLFTFSSVLFFSLTGSISMVDYSNTMAIDSEKATERDYEKQLVQKAASGDPEAWGCFLDSYSDLLYSHISYTARKVMSWLSASEIPDLVQSFYLSLTEQNGKRLKSFDGRRKCSLSSWLRVVATRHVLQEARRRKKKRTESFDAIGEEALTHGLESSRPDGPPDPREQAISAELTQCVEEVISKLPERFRLVYSLYYGDEFTVDEITERLRITKNHIYQILFQIRKRVNSELGEGKE